MWVTSTCPPLTMEIYYLYKRRKLIIIYKKVLPQKRIVVAKICGETYSKNEKNMVMKNDHKSKYYPHKLKGNAVRE